MVLINRHCCKIVSDGQTRFSVYELLKKCIIVCDYFIITPTTLLLS